MLRFFTGSFDHFWGKHFHFIEIAILFLFGFVGQIPILSNYHFIAKVLCTQFINIAVPHCGHSKAFAIESCCIQYSRLATFWSDVRKGPVDGTTRVQTKI